MHTERLALSVPGLWHLSEEGRRYADEQLFSGDAGARHVHWPIQDEIWQRLAAHSYIRGSSSGDAAQRFRDDLAAMFRPGA